MTLFLGGPEMGIWAGYRPDYPGERGGNNRPHPPVTPENGFFLRILSDGKIFQAIAGFFAGLQEYRPIAQH